MCWKVGLFCCILEEVVFEVNDLVLQNSLLWLALTNVGIDWSHAVLLEFRHVLSRGSVTSVFVDPESC